jgi:hypothetical protein
MSQRTHILQHHHHRHQRLAQSSGRFLHLRPNHPLGRTLPPATPNALVPGILQPAPNRLFLRSPRNIPQIHPSRQTQSIRLLYRHHAEVRQPGTVKGNSKSIGPCALSFANFPSGPVSRNLTLCPPVEISQSHQTWGRRSSNTRPF